jgi:hypothetical protein
MTRRQLLVTNKVPDARALEIERFLADCAHLDRYLEAAIWTVIGRSHLFCPR